jgi:hypothetical protein
MNLGPERLSFKLLYSEGINYIAYKDIDSISTKYNYHISFKRMEIDGRVIAIEDAKYLKIMEGNNLRTIKIADIDNFVMSVQDDDSLDNRIRNSMPYLTGKVNIGLEIEKGTSQKNKMDVNVHLRHKQAEHEVQLYIDYAFEKTKLEGREEVQNKDEFVGILSYKNYFKTNIFYFTSIAEDYDRPRHIDMRYIPAVGLGHKFKFDKSQWIEPSLGISYVSTDYTDEIFPQKDFTALALQLSGKYEFDNIAMLNTLIVDGFIVYYPSFTHPNEDWVMRSNLNFTVPLFDFLSVTLTFGLTNDSNPNPDIGNNKATSKLLFGVDF